MTVGIKLRAGPLFQSALVSLLISVCYCFQYPCCYGKQQPPPSWQPTSWKWQVQPGPNALNLFPFLFQSLYCHSSPSPGEKQSPPKTLICKDTAGAACDSCDWTEKNTILPGWASGAHSGPRAVNLQSSCDGGVSTDAPWWRQSRWAWQS